MKIDLGVVKIPLEGDLNLGIMTGGILWGCVLTVVGFQYGEVKGPALDVMLDAGDGTGLTASQRAIDCLGKTMLASALWCFLYYGYIGIAVGTTFNIHCFEMFSSTTVTEKYGAVGGRFSGNMHEQAPVFLVCLWSYSLLVDYETGGNLGLLYVFYNRLLYPIVYIIFGRFVGWFEFITQPGYGICGVFMLGLIMNGYAGMGQTGAGANAWKTYALAHPTAAPIYGFLVGSLGVFPYANPISILYGFLHFKADKGRQGASGYKLSPQEGK